MDDDVEDTLFPELIMPEPGPPRWEVRFRVRRRDGGEPLVPIGVPDGAAMAYWTAERGEAIAVVEAGSEMDARAAGAEACPGWAQLPGVTVEVVRAVRSATL